MSGHTPGPWTYFVGNANGRGLIRIETAHDAKPVAGVHIASMARGGVSEANARLIAAAPELLSIAERWAALDGGAWHVQRHSNEKAELLADTAVVIAKATGEQP